MRVRFAQIEPTTRCNFTCGFCCGRHMDQTDLEPSRFERILAAFPELEHVELQGEGEPLLHPHFLDMVAAIRARGAEVSFITNGSLMTSERAARVVELGVAKVMVSMESADPETFQALRGGTLEKVRRGIQALLDARRAAGAERPAVGLAITVLRRTREHVAGILALYRELGLDGGVTVQPLQAMSSYAEHYDPALVAETLDPREAADLWFGTKREPALKRIEAERRPIQGFYDALLSSWTAGSRTCPWLESGVFVNRHGQATACCMIKAPERYGFGRVGEDGIAELAAAREHMRAALRAGQTPPACEGCEIARSVLSAPLARAGEKLTSALRWATGRSTHPRLPIV